MEKEELEKLYLLYGKELTLYAWGLTKQKSDAENLVSEAFFQLALQKEWPKEVKFWLFRVIKNHFIDQQRRKKRWGFTRFNQETKSSKKQPDEWLVEQEKYQHLYQSIAKLTPPYKEVIVLFYFLEWSIQEIAEYLLLTKGQTKTILYRGRNKLKEDLRDDELERTD